MSSPFSTRWALLVLKVDVFWSVQSRQTRANGQGSAQHHLGRLQCALHTLQDLQDVPCAVNGRNIGTAKGPFAESVGVSRIS